MRRDMTPSFIICEVLTSICKYLQLSYTDNGTYIRKETKILTPSGKIAASLSFLRYLVRFYFFIML